MLVEIILAASPRAVGTTYKHLITYRTYGTVKLLLFISTDILYLRHKTSQT